MTPYVQTLVSKIDTTPIHYTAKLRTKTEANESRFYLAHFYIIISVHQAMLALYVLYSGINNSMCTKHIYISLLLSILLAAVNPQRFIVNTKFLLNMHFNYKL